MTKIQVHLKQIHVNTFWSILVQSWKHFVDQISGISVQISGISVLISGFSSSLVSRLVDLVVH